MRKSLRFVVALLLATIFSFTAFAQSVTIHGTVKNSNSKETVPAVSVTVKGTSSGTYTDDNGAFSITVNSNLPVTLIFSSVGFEAKEIVVDNVSAHLEVDFVQTSTLGQEVVMAANRAPQRILESPVTIERLSSSALRNAAVPNYYEAIANLKGVDMHTASLTFRTVTTRGFISSGNTRMNQLIDGMDNQAPGLNFSVGNIVGLTELDVDNIELLAGASSALYGSGGMNGTLLINSKNPFKYQGLSFNIKQGINHVDGKQRNPAPYYDWSMRWAKNFNDKLAIKLTGQLLTAQDWQAEDYRNIKRTGIRSAVADGNRTTDPGYDGINVYGDETSANMQATAGLFQEIIRSGIATATGGLIPNIVTTLNGAIPAGASQAQRNAIYAAAFPATLQSTLAQLDPFYWGLRNGWFPSQSVSRAGYNEEDLVDYGAMNFKFTGALHYKITPGIEASWNTYWGTGTNVYTGADRYSLRNFKMAQHRLEVKHKNWFIRGYTTQENAGEAYNAVVLGRLMQEAYSPSQTVWFPTYITAFSQFKQANTTAGQPLNDFASHAFARSIADANRPLAGSATFNSLKERIRTTPIGRGGAKFLDKSDLWATEGQLNVSDVLGFSDKLEVITGVQWKQWVMNSQGTIFLDADAPIKVAETGGYMQLRKKLFNEILTLTGAIRYDDHTNFDGRWTPRITAVVKVAQDHNIRASFQTAYRFPTNQDQYINLETGSVKLIGGLQEAFTFNGLNTGTYTEASLLAATAAGNPALLMPATFTTVLPESVSSGEIGYKSLINKKLLIDFYAYYSRYQNFFSRSQVVKAPTPAAAFNPLTRKAFSYIQNSNDIVKASGWGLGLDYLLPRGFIATANVFSDKLRDLEPGVIAFFNAPKYRVNVGFRNDNVWKNIGFNITSKWQDEYFYEGTFVMGTLPAFFMMDAQVSYKIPNSKSVMRIGGSNIGNNYRRTGFGSPYVGGVYYVSYGYNIF